MVEDLQSDGATKTSMTKENDSTELENKCIFGMVPL